MKTYKNIEEIISEAKSAGSHFFDESSMRWFNSRINRTIYGGCYFITSEKDNMRPETPRQWSIRIYKGGLDIDTVGKFCEFDSLREAVKAVKKLLKTAGTK